MKSYTISAEKLGEIEKKLRYFNEELFTYFGENNLSWGFKREAEEALEIIRQVREGKE